IEPLRRLRILTWTKPRRLPGVLWTMSWTRCSSPLWITSVPTRICVAGIIIELPPKKNGEIYQRPADRSTRHRNPRRRLRGARGRSAARALSSDDSGRSAPGVLYRVGVDRPQDGQEAHPGLRHEAGDRGWRRAQKRRSVGREERVRNVGSRDRASG